jgi:hypothetical protein
MPRAKTNTTQLRVRVEALERGLRAVDQHYGTEIRDLRDRVRILEERVFEWTAPKAPDVRRPWWRALPWL